MGHSKTSPPILRGRIRELRSLELRMEGLTYVEIGAELGITESGAYRAVQRAVKRIQEKLIETAQMHVELDLARIEKLIAALWPNAVDGSLKAIDRVNNLLARKARLLGLDAPERIKLSGDSDDPLVIEIVWPEDERG